MADDQGLVDEYEQLERLQKEITGALVDIKERIIILAKEKNTTLLFGTRKKCSIKEYEKIIYPEDKTPLLNLLQTKGIYPEVSSINYFKLNSRILKREIDQEIISLIKMEKAFRLSLKAI